MINLNITMSIIKCKLSKHSNQNAEIVRLAKKAKPNYVPTRNTLET